MKALFGRQLPTENLLTEWMHVSTENNGLYRQRPWNGNTGTQKRNYRDRKHNIRCLDYKSRLIQPAFMQESSFLSILVRAYMVSPSDASNTRTAAATSVNSTVITKMYL